MKDFKANDDVIAAWRLSRKTFPDIKDWLTQFNAICADYEYCLPDGSRVFGSHIRFMNDIDAVAFKLRFGL